MVTIDDLIEKLTYLNESEIEDVKKAYLFAFKYHEDQYRITKEPFIVHPLNVAMILTTIKDIELLSIVKEDTYYFTFKTTVSKGTYIRSLINDVSLYLGIPLTMSKLLRTRQDIFKIEDSYTLKDIEEGNYKLLDIEDILNVNVKETGKLHKKIINGNMLEYENNNMVLYKHNNENVALYVYNKEKNKMLPFIIYW